VDDDHQRLLTLIREISVAEPDPQQLILRILPELIRISGRTLLSLRRSEPRFRESEWPWLSGVRAGDLTIQDANKFICGCILELQAGKTDVWDNVACFANDILEEPDNLWRAIAAHSPDGWAGQFWEYNLHTEPLVHNRLFEAAKRMIRYYHGDARQIWEEYSDNPREVFRRLGMLDIPRSTACLVIGALKDEGYVHGAFDIVGDVVDSRVLARVACGEVSRITPYQARILARRICARDPWILDRPLYVLGMTTCAPGPRCRRCPAHTGCMYAVSTSLGLSVGKVLYKGFFGQKTIQKSLKRWLEPG
jgi:hypothetical protein